MGAGSGGPGGFGTREETLARNERYVVGLDIDDLDGFLVLSMLKLDEDTKGIPVVTCTMQAEDDVMQDESLDPPDDAATPRSAGFSEERVC